MKKFYYIALFCMLQAQMNVMALDENNNTTTWAEWIDCNIWNADKWTHAIHEAGHTTEAIQNGAMNATPGYTTIIAKETIMANGESGIAEGSLNNILLDSSQAPTMQDWQNSFQNSIKKALAGAAAEHVYNKKPAFPNNKQGDDDIIKYLNQPQYRGDMGGIRKTLKEINFDNSEKLHYIVTTMYRQTYQDQLAQKNNTFKLASQLVKEGTLPANDMYKIVNSYPYANTSPEVSLTTNNNGTDIEERFHKSGKKYSKARFKDGQLIDVKYYQENGLPTPRYTIDKNKKALLQKDYSDTKITTREHALNGIPKIGPVKSKNYKYGYNDESDYVGYKGGLDKHGKDRHRQLPEADLYMYDNNLNKIGLDGQFNKYGRDKNGNLAELD